MLNFLAELRSFKSKKLVTNDIEYLILFNTSDKETVELAKLPADTILKVTVEIND